MLNFKGIPYTTEWIQYPDIAPKFESLGLSPNASFPHYSIPTVHFHDPDVVVMDSVNIARELEKRHPTPSLHVDAPEREEAQRRGVEVFKALYPVTGTQVAEKLLDPPSREYFERTRASLHGMSLAELARLRGGDAAWEAARDPMKRLVQLVTAKGGPFVLGETRKLIYQPRSCHLAHESLSDLTIASLADLSVAGMMEQFKRLDSGVYERFIAFDAALPKLHQAWAKWLERDD